MALWEKKARRTPDEQCPWQIATAQGILREWGIETTLGDPMDIGEVPLHASDGRVFVLDNALVQVAGESDLEAGRFLAGHLATVEQSMLGSRPSALSREQLLVQVRSRLVSAGTAPAGMTTDYERPWAEGIAEVLCIDHPDSVSTVTDSDLAELAVPLDELYAVGRTNTLAEPFRGPTQLGGGVLAVEGDSMFVASRAVAGRSMFPEGHGVLLAMPNRHVLLALPVLGPGSLEGVGILFSVLAQVLEQPQPGGVVSRSLYWEDGTGPEVVGAFEDDGRPGLTATGSLAAALEVIETEPEPGA